MGKLKQDFLINELDNFNDDCELMDLFDLLGLEFSEIENLSIQELTNIIIKSGVSNKILGEKMLEYLKNETKSRVTNILLNTLEYNSSECIIDELSFFGRILKNNIHKNEYIYHIIKELDKKYILLLPEGRISQEKFYFNLIKNFLKNINRSSITPDNKDIIEYLGINLDWKSFYNSFSIILLGIKNLDSEEKYNLIINILLAEIKSGGIKNLYDLYKRFLELKKYYEILDENHKKLNISFFKKIKNIEKREKIIKDNKNTHNNKGGFNERNLIKNKFIELKSKGSNCFEYLANILKNRHRKDFISSDSDGVKKINMEGIDIEWYKFFSNFGVVFLGFNNVNIARKHGLVINKILYEIKIGKHITTFFDLNNRFVKLINEDNKKRIKQDNQKAKKSELKMYLSGLVPRDKDGFTAFKCIFEQREKTDFIASNKDSLNKIIIKRISYTWRDFLLSVGFSILGENIDSVKLYPKIINQLLLYVKSGKITSFNMMKLEFLIMKRKKDKQNNNNMIFGFNNFGDYLKDLKIKGEQGFIKFRELFISRNEIDFITNSDLNLIIDNKNISWYVFCYNIFVNILGKNNKDFPKNRKKINVLLLLIKNDQNGKIFSFEQFINEFK